MHHSCFIMSGSLLRFEALTFPKQTCMEVFRRIGPHKDGSLNHLNEWWNIFSRWINKSRCSLVIWLVFRIRILYYFILSDDPNDILLNTSVNTVVQKLYQLFKYNLIFLSSIKRFWTKHLKLNKKFIIQIYGGQWQKGGFHCQNNKSLMQL